MHACMHVCMYMYVRTYIKQIMNAKVPDVLEGVLFDISQIEADMTMTGRK